MTTTIPPRPCRCRHRRSLSLSAAWFVSVAVFSISCGVPAVAQDKPREKKNEKAEKGEKKESTKFELQALAIQATKKNAEVDKDLKPMVKTLQQTISGFTGFKLLKRATGSAEKGEAFSSELPNGFKIKITPEERTGDTVKLRVKITPPAEKGKEKEKADERDRGNLYEIKSGTSQIITYQHPDEKEDKYVIAVSAK